MVQENLPMPKLQVLIYPWVQKFFMKFPSFKRYAKTNAFRSSKTSLGRYASWYLGITNTSEELSQVYRGDELFGLIESESELEFIIDCFDVNKIPDKYKLDKSFYETQSRFEFPTKVP